MDLFHGTYTYSYVLVQWNKWKYSLIYTRLFNPKTTKKCHYIFPIFNETPLGVLYQVAVAYWPFGSNFLLTLRAEGPRYMVCNGFWDNIFFKLKHHFQICKGRLHFKKSFPNTKFKTLLGWLLFQF